MKNKSTFLQRAKQALSVLLGNATLAKKDDLSYNVMWINFIANNHEILKIGDLVCENIGLEKTLCGADYYKFIHQDDIGLRDRFYTDAYELFKKSGSQIFLTSSLYYRVLYKNKGYRWVGECGLFTTNEENEEIYIAFLIELDEENIEKVKQNYPKSLNDIQKYVDFCETLQTPVLVLDKKSFVVGNEPALKIYESDSEEEFAKNILSDVMDVSESSVLNLYMRALNGYIQNLHFDFFQSDGTRIDVVSYIYPLPHLGYVVLVCNIVHVETVDMSRSNRLLYSKLFEDNPVPMAIVDYENKTFHAANLATRELYGLGNESVKDIRISDLMNYKFDDFKYSLEEIAQKGYMRLEEVEHKTLDGKSTFFVDIFGFPYKVKDKTMMCYSLTNVSERVSQKRRLRKLGIALEHSPNFIVIIDKELKVEYVNATLLNRCGLRNEDALGKYVDQFVLDNFEAMENFLTDALNTGNISSGDILCKSHDGNHFWVKVLCTPIKSSNGNVIGAVLVGEDLTLKYFYDDQIYKLKLYDEITGLGNRQYIFNKLEEFFKKKNQKAVLCILDIDRLSSINESLGLSSGDAIIKSTANTLKEHVGKNDILARLGNDEFVFLHVLGDDDSKIDINNFLRKIIASFKKPTDVNKNKLTYDVSMGVVMLDDKSGIKEPESALRYAELAMYEAKKVRGISNYYKFSSHLKNLVGKRFDVEQNLKKALELNRFVLYYQAKVDLKSNEICGFEALLRWIDDDNNVIFPQSFIPIAEENGLILQIGDWVLEEACKQSVAWSKQNRQAKIAVNLSVKQFQEPNFVRNVKNILDKTGVNPANIELEITESMLISDVKHALDIMYQLKALGVTLAIDDFGTGYSSFAYIKQMPIDVLKVDKAFIDNLPENKKDCAIATTIITLAKELNILVVAEGIETEKQALFLQNNHCDYAQGYYYTKPLEVSEVEKL